MYGQLRRKLGEVFHELARQKECRIEEGHLLADHVHILMSIPPKYSVAQGGWLREGQERHPHRAEFRASAAELHRSALLGTRILRVHGGQG